MRILFTTLTEIKKTAKYWFSILLLICLAVPGLYAQITTLSNPVNQYGKIERIFNAGPPADISGIDSVIVYNASSIWDGSDLFEIALFIQMKGTDVWDRNNLPAGPSELWGKPIDNVTLNNTGIYSIMLVDRVVDDSIVIFSSSLREDLEYKGVNRSLHS